MFETLKRLFSNPNDPLVDRASNFLGHFIDGGNDEKDDVASALLHAADKAAKECGYGKFLDIFDSPSAIKSVADKARQMSSQLKPGFEPVTTFYSDAYAVVAVMCKHRLRQYSHDNSAQAVAEMAAELYGAAFTRQSTS
jgi:hypothetical protein